MANNCLIVGPKSALGDPGLLARRVSYVEEPPAGPIAVEAKIRYKAQAMPAELTPLPDNRARLQFESPVRGITPGQAVVFYRGEQTVGGGTIEAPVAS
jgi:tRNA-specific 2-thiouridylase